MQRDIPAIGWQFDPRRTIPFAIMLGVMIVIGIARLADPSIEASWMSTFLFILLPGLALILFGREFMRPGPVLVIGGEGIVDRRNGTEFVTWDRVAEVIEKKRPFISGLRIVLTDGSRYDIDLAFVNAEPKEIVRLIEERAR